MTAKQAIKHLGRQHAKEPKENDLYVNLDDHTSVDISEGSGELGWRIQVSSKLSVDDYGYKSRGAALEALKQHWNNYL
jgi:hypothetical protein